MPFSRSENFRDAGEAETQRVEYAEAATAPRTQSPVRAIRLHPRFRVFRVKITFNPTIAPQKFALRAKDTERDRGLVALAHNPIAEIYFRLHIAAFSPLPNCLPFPPPSNHRSHQHPPPADQPNHQRIQRSARVLAGGFAVPSAPTLRSKASPAHVCGNDVQEHAAVRGHRGNK